MQHAANYLGVSLSLLREMVEDGRIHSVKTGRRVIISIAELDKFLSGTTPTTAA